MYQYHEMALEALAKSVTSEALQSDDLVREDLEVEAHNLLWNESEPTELKLIKLLPSVEAKQTKHQFNRITSYGPNRNNGFFPETGTPPRSRFKGDRQTVNIALMGERGPTYLLASMENVTSALGASSPQAIERVALRRNVLWKKNRNLYFSDTTKTRLGSNGLRFKGIMQQIREGTDGTVGKASRFGSHIIDMQGLPLTADTLRERMARGIELFGVFNNLIMDPFTRSDLEGSLDGAQRLNLPISAKPYMIGQQIRGIRAQDNVCFFETDNTLSPAHSRWKYTGDTDDLDEGYPTGLPTVSVSAAPGTGSFDAASAGELFWVVTQKKNEIEGLGTRYPASTSAFTTVSVGDVATFTVTPSDPLIDSYLVYRGNEDDGGDLEDAWFLFEVAGDGTGNPVNFTDTNEWRPNHGIAFGLRILSPSAEALHSEESYYSVRARSSDFLQMEAAPHINTVTAVHLGPRLGVMDLARIVPTVDNPLLFSALTCEVRNPYQQVVFTNIGRA